VSPSDKMIKVTLEGSFIGCTEKQRATLKGLGLMRRGRTVILRTSDSVVGMIRKVDHLVRVEG